MRPSITCIALASALVATPSIAQIGVGVGGQVGAGVRLDTGRTLDRVGDRLDRTVDRLDRTANRALDNDLVLATRADLRTGATVRDSRGRRVGTVQAVHRDTAIVVRGNRTLHVPLAALYRSGRGLVSSLSRAQIDASARARANARADAGRR